MCGPKSHKSEAAAAMGNGREEAVERGRNGVVRRRRFYEIDILLERQFKGYSWAKWEKPVSEG